MVGDFKEHKWDINDTAMALSAIFIIIMLTFNF